MKKYAVWSLIIIILIIFFYLMFSWKDNVAQFKLRFVDETSGKPIEKISVVADGKLLGITDSNGGLEIVELKDKIFEFRDTKDQSIYNDFYWKGTATIVERVFGKNVSLKKNVFGDETSLQKFIEIKDEADWKKDWKKLWNLLQMDNQKEWSNEEEFIRIMDGNQKIDNFFEKEKDEYFRDWNKNQIEKYTTLGVWSNPANNKEYQNVVKVEMKRCRNGYKVSNEELDYLYDSGLYNDAYKIEDCRIDQYYIQESNGRYFYFLKEKADFYRDYFNKNKYVFDLKYDISGVAKDFLTDSPVENIKIELSDLSNYSEKLVSLTNKSGEFNFSGVSRYSTSILEYCSFCGVNDYKDVGDVLSLKYLTTESRSEKNGVVFFYVFPTATEIMKTKWKAYDDGNVEMLWVLMNPKEKRKWKDEDEFSYYLQKFLRIKKKEEYIFSREQKDVNRNTKSDGDMQIRSKVEIVKCDIDQFVREIVEKDEIFKKESDFIRNDYLQYYHFVLADDFGWSSVPGSVGLQENIKDKIVKYIEDNSHKLDWLDCVNRY